MTWGSYFIIKYLNSVSASYINWKGCWVVSYAVITLGPI